MITNKLLLLPFASAVLTFLIIPIVKKVVLLVGAVDHPNHRKHHKEVVPSSGGIAIFFAFIVISLFGVNAPEYMGFFIGAFLITALGFVDDIRDVPPLLKLLGQSLVAIFVIYSGIQIDIVTNPFSGNAVNLGSLAAPITFFWIIGVTNAINLLDGLDGLAAGVTGISASALGVVALILGRVDVALLAFILAAASFAFLPSNFSRKNKIFMGDSGSNFLGFSLAVIAILGSLKVTAVFSMLVPILVLAVPILDTLVVILKRAMNGRPIMGADREHLHHKLTDIVGLSSRGAVAVIYIMTLILSGVAILSVGFSTKASVAVFGGALALLALLSLAFVSKHQAKKRAE